MIKYILMFLIVFAFALPAMADEEVSLLDLFGEESKQEVAQKAEKQEIQKEVKNHTETESAAENKAEEKVDEAGMFSFLNFSFLRKEKAEEFARKSDEAQDIYEKRIDSLAEEGDVDACLTLGFMYLYGENGVEQDEEKAFKYYSIAAEKEDKIALNNLGSLYFSGIGVKKDVAKAAELFEKAAKLGNNEAAVNLAFVYLTSLPKQDAAVRSNIVRLFNQAAKGNNITAQYMMGMIYYYGYGISKNDEKSFLLLKKAATQYDEAQYQLALRYIRAEGTPRNYKNAVNNLKKSAHQGYIPSMVLLGDILAEGSSYPKNEYEAYIWYNIASVYDPAGVSQKRDLMEKKLKIEQVLQAQGISEKFSPKPTPITDYVHKTFGTNLAEYVYATEGKNDDDGDD